MGSREIEYVEVNCVKIITREFVVRERLIAPDQPVHLLNRAP
jgi:hypothetical protein